MGEMSGMLWQAHTVLTFGTLGINIGFMFMWPATTIKLFSSTNTTLDRPMTETEVALLGSLSSFGALISTPAAGILIDKLGRKYSAIISALCVVLGWTIIVANDNVEVVLTGVFVSGLSISALLVVSIYVCEICQESIRGAMTAGNIASFGLGTLLSYLLGGYLEYHVMIYVGLSMSVVAVASLLLLKESPVYLMTKGREEDAANAIAYYRRVEPDSKKVLAEINIIKRSLNPKLDVTLPEEEMLKPDPNSKRKLSIWKFLRKSPSTRQALLVNFIVVTTSIFQGLIVFQIYAKMLFEEAIPSASPTLCCVMLAVTVVASGFVSAYLTERSGRRPLMIYSSIVAGICCIVLGTQIHLHWGPNWLTAIFLYLFPMSYTCGGGTVPYVLVAEVFLPEIKGFAAMIVMEWVWFCTSIILFIFNPLVILMGLGPVFYIFAADCFVTAIYCVFYLPETKGLTVDAIQNIFIQKKHRDCNKM